MGAHAQCSCIINVIQLNTMMNLEKQEILKAKSRPTHLILRSIWKNSSNRRVLLRTNSTTLELIVYMHYSTSSAINFLQVVRFSITVVDQ